MEYVGVGCQEVCSNEFDQIGSWLFVNKPSKVHKKPESSDKTNVHCFVFEILRMVTMKIL
jgi:hypothetical protein